jgi:hypothetical protein
MLRDLITLTEQLRRMRSGNRIETACLDSSIAALHRTLETGIPMTGTTFNFCCIWPCRQMGNEFMNPIAMIGTGRRTTATGSHGASTINLRYGYHDFYSPTASTGHLVQVWSFGSETQREIWNQSSHFLVYPDFISFPTAVRRLKLGGSGVHINASVFAADQIPCSFTHDDTPATSWYDGWRDGDERLLNGRNLERGYRTGLFHDENPMFCDLCGRDLASQLYMVHGRLIHSVIHADMCVPCAARQGRGVGRGRGRLYMRHENGGWFCAAGFSFRPQTA